MLVYSKGSGYIEILYHENLKYRLPERLIWIHTCQKNIKKSPGVSLTFWVSHDRRPLSHDIPLYAPGRDRILDGP